MKRVNIAENSSPFVRTESRKDKSRKRKVTSSAATKSDHVLRRGLM